MAIPSLAPNGAGPSSMTEVHAEELETLLQRLEVDAEKGLTEREAAARLAHHGPNKLPEPPRKSDFTRLMEQFADPLVVTLLAAAIVATLVGLSENEGSILRRFGDAIAILLIVILNAILGFIQERRAEAALQALQKMAAPHARVRRGNGVTMVPAAELVPGDILELEAGDAVPADARLVSSFDMATEEASLTGESTPIGKDAHQRVAQDAPLAERATMVFLGTSVTRGKGRAVVVSTGVSTELGRIGQLISTAEQEKTPLEQRLQDLGGRLLWACLGISVLLFGWGLFKGGRHWSELLLEAVSFAVAAIPEGLPAITTITLALGMQRMAARGAIVRKLPAVETLGAASVICSDKTGTLTKNEMTVRALWAAGERIVVSGEGYDPHQGAVQSENGEAIEKLAAPIDYLITTVALCNNATLRFDEEEKRWKIIGDPTEGALLTLASKAGFEREKLLESHELVRELPFDSDRRRMTVITRDANGREIAHVKGSADVLLPMCVKYGDKDGVREMTEDDRRAIQAEVERMSAKALRVLAVARRLHPDPDRPEDALTFLGLVGMMDPPRPEVKEAIAQCHDAGIRPVMITGDHPITGIAIAKELDLWEEGDEAVSGAELARMDEDELRRRIGKIRVFARTTAEQKLQIVRAFKANGHVVAMTGDGVNDAPALREAHIGVAMGLTGTDVARQAADLVLADDNFATVVHAVHEGRAIYRNIQKFIFFLLSSNAGLAVTVFAVSFFSRTWLPLTPLMILWINLVTNGLPALALGIDPPDPNQMKEKPRASNAPILGKRELFGISYVGMLMGAAALVLYATPAEGEEGLMFNRAMAFSLLALSPLFHAWSCRSVRTSLLSIRPIVSLPLLLACLASAGIHLVAVLVPTLQPVFITFPMNGSQWGFVLLMAAAIIPAMELFKLVLRAMERRASGSRQK